MKIAVTGAHGWTGRAVIELAVSHGHTVVSIDRALGGSIPRDSLFSQFDMRIGLQTAVDIVPEARAGR